MSNFLELYRAELRKILCKRSVWVSLVLGFAFVLLVGLTNYSADGNRAYVNYQEAALSALSGQKMDDAFFERFRQEISTELQEHPDRYEQLRAIDPGALPMNAAAAIGKSDLYDFLYTVLRSRDAVMTVTAAEFYDTMRADILYDGRELGSSPAELETWLSVFDSVETPLTYSYTLAYANLLDVLFLIGWVLFLCGSVALAGVFADETACRTDAILLSTQNGRTPVCAAKLAAGITVALFESAVLLGGCFGVMVAFYGTEGWSAPIQLIIPSSPWNITIGTMLLLYFALAFVTAILLALTNLTLSHFTHSATATLAIHAAVLFAGLFNLPPKLGLLSKLWQLRPTMPLYYGTFCNTYRYGPFSNVAFSLLLFSGLAVLLAIVLMRSYRRAQMQSR